MRASVSVAAAPAEAFRLFAEEIDAWWRRGPRFRPGGTQPGTMHLEPFVGGRLFERAVGTGAPNPRGGPREIDLGRVLAWDPPRRLLLEWRNVNFAEHERTEVEVTFEPQDPPPGAGPATLVTVTHRGWGGLRPDHPARHGLEARAFLRMMGLWWGDQLSVLRARSRGG